MKELSIEQKAIAYDEAIERAKKWYNAPNSDKMPTYTNRVIEEIFPELCESEDERIRKELIDIVKKSPITFAFEDKNKVLAWLEKQGNKDKLIQELGEYKVKYTQEVLNEYLNINNKDNERLRKTTIDFLKEFADKGYENAIECIDWLEKQGNQKLPIEKLPSEMITIGESLGFTTQEECDEYNKMVSDLIMSDGKDKPKFKVGDWIIRSAEGFKHNTYLITEVKDYYVCEELKGRRVTFTFNDVHRNFKLWDISDAKPGDVLTYNNGAVEIILLFKEWKNGYIGAAHTYAHVFNDNININNWCDCGKDAHPATKEQRDLLFQKMKEAGYEWDSEKKELKKFHVIDEGKAEMDYCFTKMMNGEKVSSAWSEEDMKEALRTEYEKGRADAIAQMQKEWSEEDECYMAECINAIATKDGWSFEEKRKTKHWLKHLKDRVQPQNTWKPSDDQMHAFEQVYDWYNKDFVPSETLTSLYDDLKKLKG